MNAWKDNIHFILVEPRESGNIGASARAIKNMGFRNLSLVNPAPITDEARWLACNAVDVLNAATTYEDLLEAIRDKSIIVGTTRRIGRRRGVILPIKQATKKLFEVAHDNRVAILFGREDKGLLNKEVEECGFLLTIPTSSEQPSLNLSQAVLLVAYELSAVEYAEGKGQGAGDGWQRMVNHGDLNHLYERISETLKLLEYIPKGDRNLEKKIMQNLKHFIGRAGLTEWEMKMLYGICSQIKKKIK